MTYENILYETDGRLAFITLNRPEKLNAMSPALNREMLGVLDALELDDRCCVLVLTGEATLEDVTRCTEPPDVVAKSLAEFGQMLAEAKE